MDEQNIFLRINTDAFIHSQVIRERKNRPAHNERYTQEFLAAFDALVSGDYATAKIHCKRLKLKSLSWLLYEEFDYYRRVLKKPVPTTALIAPVFSVKAKKFEKFVQLVRDKLPKAKAFAQNYSDFLEFKNLSDTYKKLPVKHIAVCATMSAGKSTFINALLGNDILPSGNLATTARIASVYDFDGMTTISGFLCKNGRRMNESGNLSLSEIQNWNSDESVSRIYLQGDFDNISNEGKIIAIHDTPGMNNGMDKTHYEITMNFLKENPLDALVFVSNLEQRGVADEMAALSDLYKTVIKKRNIPCFFVLNKADELDSSKKEESLSMVIKNFEEDVRKIGYENFQIFPVCALAARLFKMVLAERQSQFEDFEADMFPFLFKKFVYKRDLSNTNGFKAIFENSIEYTEFTEVEDVNYPLQHLYFALEHTGLRKIEETINEI